MNSEQITDYYLSGRYRNRPKIRAWINADGAILDDMSKTYSQMTYNIDKAFGDLLDVIGAVLDIERIYIPANILFFGYEGTPAAVGYGKAAYFAPEDVGEKVPIPDHLYRMVLHFKVFYNTTDCTRSSVINAVRTLLGVTDVEIIDNEDMQYKIIIHDPIDELTIYVLNLYKLNIKPAGVKFLGYHSTYGNLLGVL